jgi:hypothetical protein
MGGRETSSVQVCGRCRSRLGYEVSTGKTGQGYGYFFCLGRHTGRTPCTLRYRPEHEVEAAVEAAWHRERPHLSSTSCKLACSPISKITLNVLATTPTC